ncbi:MAG TPA: enoyl-CoA hydratase/isomerase family protein [Thermoanaerobaculaceae bacterium]|nr:enoyl-CoA hydratase/isomerase family protein [Thermoanaerobaculaceae bacterium]
MIQVERHERVVRLTLDAPPVNVLDSRLLGELSTQLGRLAADEGIAAVLLSGAGRCFSAGASVSEHRAELAAGMLSALLDACTALTELPVPAVALVHGACLGGALELVEFCDFVIADPAATFGHPEIKLAFFPPFACLGLVRLAGLQNAGWAVLTGESFSAERAAAMGLAQKLLPKEEWGQVDALFNGLSTPALKLAKEALRRGAGSVPREALADLKDMFLTRLYRLEDVTEGIASFEEKRPPRWKHK